MTDVLLERAVALAAELQERAVALQTSAERKQQAELDRMLDTPEDKATLVQLTDQAFRSGAPPRVAEQFTHILDVQGMPRFFSPLDRAMLRGFQTFGGWLPGVTRAAGERAHAAGDRQRRAAGRARAAGGASARAPGRRACA